DVSKRTIAATKLAPGDRVAAVETAAGQDHLVLQTKNGYLLRFPLEEVPDQKKAAMGVRGIRLSSGDLVEAVYILEPEHSLQAEAGGRMVSLNRLKVSGRDGKGTKVRG